MIGNKDRIDRIRLLGDEMLRLLREERGLRPRDVNGHDGGRELSEAITCIQTGCMYVNESCFVDEREYTPHLKR